MGIKDDLKRTAGLLRLDRHHAIERYIVIFTALALTGLMVCGSTVFSAFSNSRKTLGSTAMYTEHFTTSKTQSKGDVVGVYSNNDHTRAMVLMKFQDVSKVSTDASTYQGFITGSDVAGEIKQLKSKPSGSVYVFGLTGYIGVYMVNEAGFDTQLVNLTMRANSELVPLESSSRSKKEANEGESFSKYDQWRVFFNPGASETTKLKALETETPDVKDLYYEMVSQPAEAKLRNRLDQDLIKLRADQAMIVEKTKRLSMMDLNGTKLRPMNVPKEVVGDRVVGDAPVEGKELNLALKTEHVPAGGYDYDWRSGNIKDGYIDKLVPKGQDYVDWMSKKAAATDTQLTLPKPEDWVMTDGSRLIDKGDGGTGDNNSTIRQMNTTVSELVAAYSTYQKDKSTYMRKDLGALLYLEADLRGVKDNNTVNASENALLVY